MRIGSDPHAVAATAPARTNGTRAASGHGRCAARQSRGARLYQEDSFGLLECGALNAGDPAITLLVLADGMGGHAGGDTASSLAVNTAIAAFAAATGPTAGRLRQALDAANGAIAAAVRRDPRLAGIGCTFVGVAITAAGVEWISVGDSPLWLFHAGQLQRLNADHSMVPVFAALVAEGAMSEADARSDSKRHILRSALTGDEIKLIDTAPGPLPLAAPDRLLLASDGLLSLGEARIAAILVEHLARDPEAPTQALIAAVDTNGAPNQDNTTILLFAPEG